MRSGLASTVRVALAGAALLALAGCGGDETVPPVVVITPAPVRGIIAASTDDIKDFQSDVWLSVPVLLSQRGVLDITVDWTFPDTWMYVYFGRTSCNYNQLAGRACPFMMASETKDPKPRVLYTEMLDVGTYYLYLYNVPRNPRNGTGSDNTERVSLQLGLTVFPGAQSSPEAVHLGRPIVVSPPRL
jgi:hypothetical protein